MSLSVTACGNGERQTQQLATESGEPRRARWRAESQGSSWNCRVCQQRGRAGGGRSQAAPTSAGAGSSLSGLRTLGMAGEEPGDRDAGEHVNPATQGRPRFCTQPSPQPAGAFVSAGLDPSLPHPWDRFSGYLQRPAGCFLKAGGSGFRLAALFAASEFAPESSKPSE